MEKSKNGEGDILLTRKNKLFGIRWMEGANWQFDEQDNSFDDGVGRGNWGFNFSS